jgi:sulfur-carrier protein
LSVRRITILYFASVREAVGQDSEARDISADITTPRALISWLAVQGPGHAAAFADLTRLRVAIDQQLADLDAPLGDAREIAFFPPVTGG